MVPGEALTFRAPTTGVYYELISAGTNSVSAGAGSYLLGIHRERSTLLSCPAPVSASNDAGLAGAVIAFEPLAGSGVTVSATPASGSFFPIGTTTVLATATDADGNIATCSFTVTVHDLEPPAIEIAQPLDGIPAESAGDR